MKSGYAQVTGFCKIPGPCYKEKQSLAGRNKQELLQETTEGTRTGEKRLSMWCCFCTAPRIGLALGWLSLEPGPRVLRPLLS